MIGEIQEKVAALLTDLLQDYFEIQMLSAFGNSWKDNVKTAAEQKVADGNHYVVYRNIASIINSKGLQNVSVKDFDITILEALMLYDFNSKCCTVNSTDRCGTFSIYRQLVALRTDRNRTFGHISNYHNLPLRYALLQNTVDDMRSFVNRLRDNNWVYLYRDNFFRTYLGTGNDDGHIDEVEKVLREDRGTQAEHLTYLTHKLAELERVRNERAKEYICLSYNRDGHAEEKKTLDELITDNIINTTTGMKIVAEGGFGKTWTLGEIAGRFATEYLDNDNANAGNATRIPLYIPLGQLHRGCPTIIGLIAQMLFMGNVERTNEFLRSRSFILFLDALDEAQADLQSGISREIRVLKDNLPNVIFVCASRKSCIDKYPSSIPCYTIKMLDDTQIIQFLEKAIPDNAENREELLRKAKNDWDGENRKAILHNNRTPFYLSCYIKLLCENGDNEYLDTTQMVEKYLNAVIERELQKTGLNADRKTFMDFLKELCRLLDMCDDNGSACLSIPESDAIREISNRLIIEDGQLGIKTICRKLVEIRILSLDEDMSMLSFAHQNYKDFINRKYPRKRYFSYE